MSNFLRVCLVLLFRLTVWCLLTGSLSTTNISLGIVVCVLIPFGDFRRLKLNALIPEILLTLRLPFDMLKESVELMLIADPTDNFVEEAVSDGTVAPNTQSSWIYSELHTNVMLQERKVLTFEFSRWFFKVNSPVWRQQTMKLVEQTRLELIEYAFIYVMLLISMIPVVAFKDEQYTERIAYATSLAQNAFMTAAAGMLWGLDGWMYWSIVLIVGDAGMLVLSLLEMRI